MVFAQRDSLGKIVGVYANKQDGYAEENIDIGSLEVVEFFESFWRKEE